MAMGKVGAGGRGFGKEGSTVLGGAGVQQIAIPTTNLKAVYSAVRVNGWTGACLRVQRSSDTTQTDIGFAGNVVDKVAADTFAAGSTLTVAKWYDQSGNGLDLVQTADANRPVFSSLNEYGAVRPVTFDGWPTAANPKFMDTPTLSGIDRSTLSVYMMVQPRSPNQQTAYFEGFSDAGFATSAVYFADVAGAQGASVGGAFTTSNKYPRAHLQALSVVSNGTNIRYRFDGDDKTIPLGAATSAVQAFRFGKLSISTNYHAAYDLFCIALYAQADLAAANATIETALNASFKPDRASSNPWTKQLIVDGSSLETGSFATALQNSDWQGTFGRGPQSNVREWEYYNMAIAGTTLSQQNSAKSHVTGIINLARSKVVISAGGPSNDIAVTTYTSQADAETGNVNSATNLYNNLLLPYVQAMIAAGVTRVIVPTIIPRSGFNTSSNWRENARTFYNGLVVAGAAANNYTVADMAAIPQLATFDSTYYASDNIHLKPAGYLLMENVRKPMVLAA